VYGPVCTVVWEGRSREAPPYPDLLAEAAQVSRADRRPNLGWAVDGDDIQGPRVSVRPHRFTRSIVVCLTLIFHRWR
jgi:hypothetical protein